MTEQTFIQENKKILLYLAVFIGIYATALIGMTQLSNVEELKGEIQGIVESYGIIGLFFIVVVLDSFTQPISPDIAVFSAVYFTDLSIWSILIVAGIASGLAGYICYSVGRRFGMPFLKKSFHSKTIARGEKIMSKHGVTGVFIGAVTPVPYDVVCYLSGIFRVNKTAFIFTSFVGRLIRFAVLAFISLAML